MPSLTFVLPHWLYWAVLALFPLVAIYLVHRQSGRTDAGRPNMFLAYLFLVIAGFIGMHRFYLRNGWGLVFIPVFLAILWTSAEVRNGREAVSQTRQIAEQGERLIARAEADAKRKPEGADQRIAEAKAKAAPAETALSTAQADLTGAESHARIAAIVLAIMLLIEVFLVPALVRRARAREVLPPPLPEHPMATAVP